MERERIENPGFRSLPLKRVLQVCQGRRPVGLSQAVQGRWLDEVNASKGGLVMSNPIQVAIALLGSVAMLSTMTDAARAQVATAELLQLETKIPLGDVRGRIDHMVVDRVRNRLVVAELENDSVAIVDLKDRKVLHVISGLKEPQGVAYVPSTDMLYVANE